MTHQFKIGDIVRTIKTVPSFDDNYPPIPIGSIGEVTFLIGYNQDPNPESGDMCVNFNGVKWHVNHQDIEKV